MGKGLFYSEEALINRVFFLSDSNEINIIVEDENKEFEYERIFSRLFSDQLNINNIFPMKGKPGVKKAFEEYGAIYDNKPAIYIVDGDFDAIMNKDMVEHSNYIYLDKYNIESYYVDKGATLKYMSGKLKKRQKDVVKDIEYEKWENDTYNKFKELFINYIIGQTVFQNEVNVGISPYVYIDDQGWVDTDKVDAYVIQLKNRIPNYEKWHTYYNNRFEQLLEGDATRLICGKYIIASLARYLRTKTKSKFREEDFRYYLVGEFDMGKLVFLKERITSIIQTLQTQS